MHTSFDVEKRCPDPSTCNIICSNAGHVFTSICRIIFLSDRTSLSLYNKHIMIGLQRIWIKKDKAQIIFCLTLYALTWSFFFYAWYNLLIRAITNSWTLAMTIRATKKAKSRLTHLGLSLPPPTIRRLHGYVGLQGVLNLTSQPFNTSPHKSEEYCAFHEQQLYPPI